MNSAVTHQTMIGWEVLPSFGDFECNPQAVTASRSEVVNRTIDEIGVDRVRLSLRSGFEHPTDYLARLVAGQMTFDEWKRTWFVPVNDNSDPRVINPAGFQFSWLDREVEDAVLPMRQRLAARGERLYVNLAYTDFFDNTPFEQRDDPEEYAELVLAGFLHLRQKYQLIPDALEILVEPDNAAWSAEQVTRVIVPTVQRLAAAGFRPAIIAPSTASMAGALRYFDRIRATPNALQYVTDLSYHRYEEVSESALRAIAARAAEHRIRTGMLEYFPGGVRELHEDLTLGRVSAWQQFGMAFCGDNNRVEGLLFILDQSTPARPRVVMTSRARYLQQYFRYVRANAVRVDAITEDAALQPVAFRNSNGKLVVVVRVQNGSAFNIVGLPAGSYGTTYTTENAYSAAAPDATIPAGQVVPVLMPEGGVVTIFAR